MRGKADSVQGAALLSMIADLSGDWRHLDDRLDALTDEIEAHTGKHTVTVWLYDNDEDGKTDVIGYDADQDALVDWYRRLK